MGSIRRLLGLFLFGKRHVNEASDIEKRFDGHSEARLNTGLRLSISIRNYACQPQAQNSRAHSDISNGIDPYGLNRNWLGNTEASIAVQDRLLAFVNRRVGHQLSPNQIVNVAQGAQGVEP